MRARVPLATIMVLMSAGSALAADGFAIGAIDAGGVTGSDPLASLMVVGGTIYQNAFGSDFEPNQAFIGLAPELEFDSYVTVDHSPVTAAPGYNGGDVPNASFLPGSTGFTGTSLGGAWFITGPFVSSVMNPSTNLHEVFVARITHTGMLTGYLGTTISEDNVTTRTVGSGLGATFDSDTMSSALEETYVWIVRETTVEIGGTNYTVSDLYLQQGVPTPGAVALLGVGGIAATRRRRR